MGHALLGLPAVQVYTPPAQDLRRDLPAALAADVLLAFSVARIYYACARIISNPHDGLVELTFGQIEHARGELRAIVPPALAEALHWSALAVQPGSFVDAALAHQHIDLLYSLTWRDGRDALVYLLFEHQSGRRGCCPPPRWRS